MIYSTIKKIATEKEITIGKLCEASGVKRSAMQEWDSHIPAADKLASVAKCLGVTVEDLLGGEETC